MGLSLTSLKMLAPPFDFGSGLPSVAGPYRIDQYDVYVAGVIRGQVFKAGATQSVCFVAGSERGQVSR